MDPRPTENLLRCQSCERYYPVPELDRGRAYVCARCDAVIAGPERAASRSMTSSGRGPAQYLYGGRAESPEPAAARPASGGVLADQTWAEGIDAELDDEAPKPLGSVGRYALQAELGRGGMGVVYRAWDADLGRSVAVKLLLHGGRAGQAQVERFLREARAGARLDHPNLVRVSDIGRHEGQVFFTMDLVDGPSVADVLRDVDRFPVGEAARIVAEAARGVHHAHLQGIVHRDLKPGNILLDPLGRALVTDFGLVKHVTGDAAQLTATGQVLGTPAYMAPEQARGQPATVRSDVYSLGAALYEMLSGRAPYSGDNAAGVLIQVVRDGPPTVQSVTANLPVDLALVCATAMAREPERRYATALELAQDLERWQRGEPVLARAPSTSYRVQRWLRQHPRTTAAVAALVAVGLVGTGAGLATMVLQTRQERARLERADGALAALLTEVEALDGAGDGETAARRLETFVAREDFAGTPAISAAWLASARRSAARGDPEAELTQLASAWRTAVDEPTRMAAGLALARSLRGRWRFDALESALSALIHRIPAAADDPEVRRLRLEAALGRGDLGAAVARSKGSPIAPVVEALAHRTVPGIALQKATAGDLDGDGKRELIGLRGDQLVRLDATPALTELSATPFRVDRPAASTLIAAPWPGGDRLLLSSWEGQGSRAEIWRWEQGEPVLDLAWDAGYLCDATSADLDRDGAPELYVGLGMGGRTLTRLTSEGAGWNRSRPDPDTAALNSDIAGLAAADLDGDGALELIAGASLWGGFDVRVYRPEGDRLERAARYRVGETLQRSVAVIEGAAGPLVAVAKSRRLPSRDAYPPEDPFGPPSGVYLFRYEGGELFLDRSLPLPGPVGAHPEIELVVLRSGDLDGDGLADFAVSVHTEAADGVFVGRGLPDGEFATAFVGGERETLLIDLDADGNHELVQSGEDGLAVLGMGSLAVAAHSASDAEIRSAGPRAEPLEAAPPVSAEAGHASAEELAAIGLWEQAAAAFEDLAAQSEAPGAAWLRAGELWEAAGQPERAARAWLDAAATEPGALSRAAEAWIRAHAVDEVHEVADRLASAGAPPPSVDLGSLRGEPVLDYPFAGALDERWRVSDPVGLAWDRSAGALQAELFTWSGPVLTRALTWDGEHVRIEVDLEVDHAEWGTSARVGLRVPGSAAEADRRLAVGVQTAGGGGLYERRTGCVLPGQPIGMQQVERVPYGDRPWKVHVALDYLRATGTARCETRVDGLPPVRRTFEAPALAPGPIELYLYGAGETQATASTALRIDRIALRGVREADPPPETPWELGARHWVNRAPELARKAWLGTELDPDQRVARALARAAGGDLGGAAQDLGDQAAGDPSHALQAAIRADPLRIGLVLATLDPELPIRAVDAATPIARQGHADEVWLGRLLDQGISGLDSAPPSQGDLARRLRLLAARGRGFRAAGSQDAALQDLRRVLELAEPHLDDWQVQQVALSAHQQLGLALASSDPDAALVHLRAAVELSGGSVRLRDFLRTRPELAPYRDLPAWRAVLDEGPELLLDGTERRPG